MKKNAKLKKTGNEKKSKPRVVKSAKASRAVLILGMISAVLFSVYVSRAVFIADAYSNILVGCVALIVILMAIAIRDMATKPFRRFLAGGLATFLLSYVFFVGWTAFAYRGIPESADEPYIIIVAGCRTNGWQPSATLKQRLDRTAELMNACPNAVCIVSGGQGSNESVAEGLVMKKYLTDAGIADDRIFTETKATDTEENLRFSYEIIQANGWEARKIIAVSSDYHLPRIKLICRAQGYGDVLGYGASQRFGYQSTAETVREYMAIWLTGVRNLPSLIRGFS